MRILIWNTGNGGPGSSQENHDRVWRYLEENREGFDVALLQETRDPRPEAEEHWRSVVWRPKYDTPESRRPLWGSAIIARDLDLVEHEPDAASPWLTELGGSVAIARSGESPVWLASVHASHAPVSPTALERNSVDGIPLAVGDGSVWEADVIPHDLRRLAGDETFLWGGDLNSAVSMDGKSWFLGGNQQLRETWAAAGSVDLRSRFHAEEQRTYFRPGKGNYQLDHAFADAETERRVADWSVDATLCSEPHPLSDHAPITVVLEPGK